MDHMYISDIKLAKVYKLGVIFALFAVMLFSRKCPPSRIWNPYDFIKEIWLESWKLHPREKSSEHFREFIPIENNLIYSRQYLRSWIVCLTSQLTIFQSYMWRHIDVQADWRRSMTYGRAPNAIDIS